MPPLPADSIHARACKLKCEKILTRPHFVSLLSVIGGWGGVLPPHFGQKKSRRPFSDFLLGVPLYGRRVFSCKSSGQVDPI